MRFSRTLAAALSLLGGVAALADESLTDNNAALQYWQASASITDSSNRIAEDIDKAEFNGAVLGEVSDRNARMDFLHAGAAMPRCEWGIDFRKGPETLLPHLNVSRTLCRLAVLRARYRFENGRHRDGVDDLLATFELSKDVGQTPVLICSLVRYHLERLTIDTLARELPRLDRATLEYLGKQLESIPAEDALRKVWPQESKYFVDWTIERLDTIEKEAAGDPAKWSEGVLGLAIFQSEDARELRRIGVPAPKEFRAIMESVKGLLVVLGRITDLPPTEQDAQLEALNKPFKGNPVTKVIVPDQGKIFRERRRWQAMHAMLDAAVAVLRDGEKALNDNRYTDPFGNGPFAYRKSEKGFELKSKLMFEGKPVVLAVGK